MLLLVEEPGSLEVKRLAVVLLSVLPDDWTPIACILRGASGIELDPASVLVAGGEELAELSLLVALALVVALGGLEVGAPLLLVTPSIGPDVS